MPLPDRCVWSEAGRRARLISRLHTVEQMQLRMPQLPPHGPNQLCNKCSSLTEAVWVEADERTVKKYNLPRDSLIVSQHVGHSPQGGHRATKDSLNQTQKPGSDPWHHHNLPDLMESARQGCHFCFVIWHSSEFEAWGKHNINLEKITGDYRVAKLYAWLPFRDNPKEDLTIRYSPEDASLLVDSIVAAIEFEHFPADSVLTQVEPAPDIHSMDFGKIRQWLEDCTLHHDDCQSYSRMVGNLFPQSRPSRIISVKMHHNVVKTQLKLTSNVSENARYATLSYCWGDRDKGAPANLELKRDNVADFMDSIPVADMPKTVLDAAVVTVSLGLEYLWVDALCIVQDDKEDWNLEASKMPQIYANGYVNIAAVSATHCDEGLDLLRRERMEMNPLVLNLHWDRSLQGRFLAVAQRPWNCLKSSPLGSRAWTLQEAILGFKTVHFARDYVRWTCKTTSASNAGEHGFIPIATDYFDDAAPFGWIPFLAGQYADRQLTRKPDRLIALAGIAQLWARAKKYTPDDYLAGVWKPNLFVELLWCASVGRVPQSEFVAPSWSWASLDGPFSPYHGASFRGPYGNEEHPHFRLLEASIKHSGTGSFGSVSHGALRVQGMLRRVQMGYPLAIGFNFGELHDYREVFQSLRLGYQLYNKKTILDGHQFDQAPIREYLDDRRMYEELECDCFFLPLARKVGKAINSKTEKSEPDESEPDESGPEESGPDESGPEENEVKRVVEGLLLQPVAGNPGIYRRIGVLVAFLFEGTPEMHEFWEVGCQLETEEYQGDCDRGVYEFAII